MCAVLCCIWGVSHVSIADVADTSTAEPISLSETDTHQPEVSTVVFTAVSDKAIKTFRFLKGQPVRDSILLGMWSYHFDAADRKISNQTQNLLGVQFKGINLSTYNNSNYDQSYFLGVARNVYTKNLGLKDLELEAGYRAGAIYGYGDQFPNVFGVSPLVIPVVGLSYKMAGVDFVFVPGTWVGSINCRINVDKVISKISDKLKEQHQ